MKKNAPFPAFLLATRNSITGVAGFLVLSGLFLAGCSDNDPHQRFSYLRSAGDPSVDTVPADTLCADPGPNFRKDGFDPVETCKRTKKFILRWERPEDTADFRGYRLYLDTTPGVKTWKATQGDDREAALIIPGFAQPKDGLVFFFYDDKALPPGIAASPRPDTVKAGNTRIFGLDTSGRLEEERQRFVFALATRHEGGTPGQPQYTFIITGDKFAPAVFKPFIAVKARSMDIDWSRPNDPTSFFDPGADTGIILNYELTVRLHGRRQAERSVSFKPSIRYLVGGVDRSAAVKESVITTADGDVGRSWMLPDSARARRGAATQGDSLHVEVLGLAPQDSLDVILFARDSAGNRNDRSMPNDVTVIMTDTTRPTTPEIAAIDSLTTRNAFVIRWTASRDSTDSDGNGVLEPGASPNAGIRSYRLTRSAVRDSGAGADALDRSDTVIAVSEANAGDTVFHDTVRFLPPGRTYLVVVTAVDLSGFVSEADSVLVTTDSIRFAGADSGFVCPPGMVPIPAARFRLGESDGSAAAQNDERPGRALAMGAFCIEPYEHRDTLGNFATKVTWKEADSICAAMSADSSTMLCSEAEWERACEGFDILQSHIHGIQSERSPAVLQASCNQATGDSVMAMSFDLRNPICLTNEGVYDMAGNLSEWVRDPYNPGAYASYTDSVMAFGFTFAAGGGDTGKAHSIRGGNFLKPGISASAAQNLARCSNRDFPMQIRPLTKAECVDPDRRKVAVIYGEGPANVKCFAVPDSLEDAPITDMIPDRDSTLVRYFRSDASGSRTFPIPPDSAFKGKKPVEVRFTTQALLEVVFERKGDTVAVTDTLDARELRNATPAMLDRILQRESPSPAWAPRRSGDSVVARRLFAHVITGSKVAKAYFANRAIGFRCCGKPRPRTPAATVARRP